MGLVFEMFGDLVRAKAVLGRSKLFVWGELFSKEEAECIRNE